jgi:catechol 2,3-dioxygenase-like lactoylglutathione lyase family enzyme
MIRHAVIAATLLLGAAASAHAAAPTDPLPAALKPTQVAGSGFNVIDLEAQRAWYASHLGMAVVGVYGPKDKPYEYVMAMGDGPNQPVIALLKTKRPDGPNGFSRLILLVPDPKGLARRLADQGAPMREVIADTAYFITDPEGNAIELYRPPAK